MPFFAFEGLDGSGKSSLIQAFSSVLKKQDRAHVITREPGGTHLGQKLRKILLEHSKDQAPSPLCETLLYQADRAQNIDKVIRPALKRGDIVISDRYWASTLAFQQGGRCVDAKLLNTLTALVCDQVQPDLWVLLDLPVETSLKRLASKKDLDRFEVEQKDFHERVRSSYLNLARSSPSNWLILDASQSSDEVLQNLLHHLKQKNWLD